MKALYNTMTYSPIIIANYFIQEKGKFGKLTPMKLIKLTYLAYSWYLTLNNGKERLTFEKPQAWDYGPVFPSLYQSLKRYGRTEIGSILHYDKDEVIDTADSEFLNKIWSMYGKYDGVQLSAMTHSEDTPWKSNHTKGYNYEISDEAILEHYIPKLKPVNS